MESQGHRTLQSQGPQVEKILNKIGGAFKLEPKPQFREEREAIFLEMKQQQAEIISKAEKPDITIRLKDGKEKKGVCFTTTPFEIAKGISKNLAEKVLVARVRYTKRHDLGLEKGLVCADADEEHAPQESEKEEKQEEHAAILWDLDRPLEGDCELELLDFEDPKGKETFWHSSAHILGAALEEVYGSHLAFGPPLDQGFFYDSFMGENQVHPEDYKAIETAAEKLVDSKQPYERLVISKQDALKLFQKNPFKVSFINAQVPDGGSTSVYRCGKLIDLCTGPHLPNTNRVKAFQVTQHSAAYWLGKNTNDDLQRVYAIAFPAQKQLDEYVKRQEELAKRDHRNVGKQQELFKFHEFSPGACFFFPEGAHIYNTLLNLLRKQYLIRGYKEVITPNMYNSQLWVVSGHWEKYQENMFIVNLDDGQFGFKPMNCPGHCLMFDSTLRSWRDLPIRYADFGVLHRNELSGALTGLTRVRRFQQDDAHIFCRVDQIQDEIVSALQFIDYIYGIFGFQYTLALSTRPEKYLGEISVWDEAEEGLAQALKQFGKEFSYKHGDGAFYGPKIDIQLYDAFDRAHQCATIQLDFQLPIRFNLQYRGKEGIQQVQKIKESHLNPEDKPMPFLPGEKTHLVEEGQLSRKESHQEDQNEVDMSKGSGDNREKKYHLVTHHLKPGFHRPVIIHRAILGSFERFIAILTENTGGKWPFWVSPKQIRILPISEQVIEYAHSVCNRLTLEGFQVSVDESSNTLNQKIREAQLEQWNYIVVVGEDEARKGTIALRQREASKDIGQFFLGDAIKFLQSISIPHSKEEEDLKGRSYYGRPEFRQWNEELCHKTFFDGDGFMLGEKDKSVYDKIHDDDIDSTTFPNLNRWFNYMKKLIPRAPREESVKQKGTQKDNKQPQGTQQEKQSEQTSKQDAPKKD